MPSSDERDIANQAYEAFASGNLAVAATHFERLLQLFPNDPAYHYMQGLTHKYLRAWDVSLRHNLRSLALRSTPDEASMWNAGIAATALGDWAEARRQWAACGIAVPDGAGPIDGDFGFAAVRLNPWGNGETLYGRRIDLVRMRLLNVPLPESGFRYGDIVLHDGASTGTREVDGRQVPVFNAMERVERSPYETFAVFIACDDPATLTPLLEADAPDVVLIEDWTDSINILCMRCSYGTPHRHADRTPSAWNPERSIGIAAKNRASLQRVLDAWKDHGIVVDAVESRDFPLSSPSDGIVWWEGPEEAE